ncbi:MAG: NAD(P)/FAD-dependent oxidoreductase [Chthoniobacterales bacterium]
MDDFSAQIVVVGGGPAGLRAAEIAAAGGAPVTLFDAKASVGRKFLVAGGGGLNLTKEEEAEHFAARYRGPRMPHDFWRRLVAEFGPEDLRAWAAGLGVETFVASTGRVYPSGMKAAPLLRAWVRRLRSAGVEFALSHRLSGLNGTTLSFVTPTGPREVHAGAVVLALGGGSWPETGSDGGWVNNLRAAGVDVATLQPANSGWSVAWPVEVLAMAGSPLKNVVVRTPDEEVAGELMLTTYGLEGGAIYALGASLRGMTQPEVGIDFKPGVTVERLVARFGTVRETPGDISHEGWEALTREAAERWRLGAAALAVLRTTRPLNSVAALAARVKDCRIALGEPRPLAEAISSAGGVRWGELDGHLMLRRMPGVFVAGEMIDWEAPTGGYLLHGAFATGSLAARGALQRLTP